jgi:hypothetical protein
VTVSPTVPHVLFQPRHLRVSVPLAVLALTALADVLFYRHPLGWTLGLYALVTALLLALHARPWARRSTDTLLVLILPPAIALVLRTGWLAVAMLAVLTAALAVAARGGAPAFATRWPAAAARIVTPGAGRLFADWARVSKWRRRRKPAARAPRRLWRNWGLPLAFTLVFLFLFTAANPVLAYWLRDVRAWIENLLANWFAPLRWLFWFAVAITAWALLRHRQRRPPPAPPPLPPLAAPLEPVVPLVRTLSLFNALFALQNALDIRYLWLGATLPDGMTYAEYAHRGAYPLVVTALLAGAFILWAFRPGREDGATGSVRALLHAWIGQNVFLTAGSAWRLWLYVGVFGLSRLRVAAAAWMALVAIGLILTGVRLALRRSNNWLIYANLLPLYLVLSGWTLINVDGRIAAFNVAHCREMGGPGVPLDMRYLRRLGPAALPALDRVAAAVADRGLRQQATIAMRDIEHNVARQMADWRGWTLLRQRLLERKREEVRARGVGVGVQKPESRTRRT